MKYSVLPFIILLALTRCDEPRTSESRRQNVPVAVVAPIDTFAYNEYSAQIYAIQNIELRARVSGYLDKIHIDEGQKVAKGQLLFSINDVEYREELSKAMAAYQNAIAEEDNASIGVERVKRLLEKNVVSKSELSVAENKLHAAKARTNEARAVEAKARLELSYTQVRAPFTGKVNRITHRVGSLVNEGTLLTTLTQDDEVYAYFNLSEKEYLNYAFNAQKNRPRSREVSLVLANGKMHAGKGYIETMESEIDRNTGNIAFRARFSNPGNILKHGASGKIRLKKEYNDVLVIPQKSAFEIQDKVYVYVVDDNDTVRTRPVTTLNPLPHLLIVSSGLRQGERIVCEGIQNIRDGQMIVPEPVSLRKIFRQLASR